MKSSYKEYLVTANFFLEENELDKAIESFELALAIAPDIDQKIDLLNVLGKLFQKTKKPVRAISMFERSITLYDQFSDPNSLSNKASLYNNLGAIYLESDLKIAISNYKNALNLYSDLVESGKAELKPHLGNTNFALAEAYYEKGDFYFSKKYFKEAIKLYDQLPKVALEELKASAYYNLGNMYTEEFNLHDAKVNYLKALSIYKALSEKDLKTYQPFLAAVYNNLGVTFKSMDEYSKSLEYYQLSLQNYEHLAKVTSPRFYPYLAATYNSLAIAHAEHRDFKKAIEYTSNTSNIYGTLANDAPEEYDHYLATSLHNQGLFYLEIKDLTTAEYNFKEALALRKMLAQKEPRSFDADVCATALNLIELYQIQLESTLDLSLKAQCLEMLSDVKERLNKFKVKSPVLTTMETECGYYTTYFNQITGEALQVKKVFKEVDQLTEEINSTIIVTEKIDFQQTIVNQLEELHLQFLDNDKIKNELAYGYNNLSWLFLRLKQFSEAENIIVKAQLLEQPILPLKANLAHSYLLQDNYLRAKNLYKEFINETNAQNEPYSITILKDLNILQADGIDHKDFDKIRILLNPQV
ncbi:MAG: tetratricopeptide repeat protein [Maribacter sp.]|nr:tetratricopeptide repeat protein [Maribacter sp.]